MSILKKSKSPKPSQTSNLSSISKRIKKTLAKDQNQFAELAPLIEISFTDNVTGEKIKQKFPRRKSKTNEDSWVLLWNIPKKELWGVKRGRTVDITEVVPDDLIKRSKAYKLYKDFNGWEEPNVSLTRITKPFKWEKVGKAEHVVYHSDKNNRYDFYDYIHPFGDNGYIQIKDHGVNLFYDRINKIFKISGGRLTVTERGIVY